MYINKKKFPDARIKPRTSKVPHEPLKVVPSLIKYRNDINEIEYINSYRSKNDSKNFL